VAGDGVGAHHYDCIVLNVLVKRGVERRGELTEVREVWHAGTEIGLCY